MTKLKRGKVTAALLIFTVSRMGWASQGVITNHNSQNRNSIETETQENPEGYYAFIESSKMEPPQVRPPPYFKSSRLCPGVSKSHIKTLNNLCGDLNKGFIPMNPMRQNIFGTPYPFDIIKNKTLEFLSRALPILQRDETLPKVAKYQQASEQPFYHDMEPMSGTSTVHRIKREEPSENQEQQPRGTSDFIDGLNLLRSLFAGQINETHRQARKFCENSGGVLCMLYKLIQGGAISMNGMAERRDDGIPDNMLRRGDIGNTLTADRGPEISGPPTPCPAKVEYATPVFARNYQGIWRYVVQIPYEGYFTQTVELTRCLQTKCHYMEGGCLSSPRWVSLLVAEIFYPEAVLPASSNRRPPQQPPRTPVAGDDPPPLKDPLSYQQQLHKRIGAAAAAPEPNARPVPQQLTPQTSKPAHCDGIDEIGCFQVRLYYDWFLVPGSCKCWRPDYFSRYTRRKPNSVSSAEL
ncbi:spaetzle domain-containing protein 6 [Lycorma delicatula]|uniref:spaetzle domain-containing protein 6 n=1 Tax=Lycorma delicatula TaxID=130591 RepID=UPI003F513A27